jgi:hypothetical protein
MIYKKTDSSLAISITTETDSTSRVFQSYEPRQFDLIEDTSQSELGQKNDGRDIRDIITNQKLGHAGLRIVGEVRGVDYGTWNGVRACFVQFGFQFRRTRDNVEVEHVEIHLDFNTIGKRPGAGDKYPTVLELIPAKANIYSTDQEGVWKYGLVQSLRSSALGATDTVESPSELVSINGELWPQGKRRAPWGATWKLFNSSKDGLWRFEHEVVVSVVVESEALFQGSVQISAAGNIPGLFHKSRFSGTLRKLWSKDDPLFFNQKTIKGLTLPKTDWQTLNWLRLPQFQYFTTASTPVGEPQRSKVSKRPNSTTYRVRGLPIEASEHETKLILEQICQIESPKVTIAIHSLARNPRRLENVATVVFSQTPEQFADYSKEEWSLKGHNNVYDLVFDVHFRGLTPLADPRGASVE